MTVSTTKASDVFPGNGIATGFDCAWRIFDNTDILVSLVDQATGADTPLVLNTDYTISGTGNQAGFTVATMTPVASGTNLYVRRALAYKQPTDFTNQGAFFPTMHEDAIDRLEMQIQQLADENGRAIRLPAGLAAVDGQIPTLTPLGPLIVNADGTGIEVGDTALTGDMLLRPNLASAEAGKGASMIGYLSGTVKSFLDSLAADAGATLIKYKAGFIGAIQRTLGSIAEDQLNSEWFGPDRTGTSDASAALQLACNAAAGRVLTIRPGTYLIGAALQVPSNTTIRAYGAIFKRIGTVDNILRNKADGVTGGWSANANISIFGGTWDANYANYAADMSIFAFGHCFGVTVRDAAMVNGTKYHHIEVNSSGNVLIENCSFTGGNTQAGNGTEGIQIDSADTVGQFPWFGPFDNTVCNNIVIRNCTFTNCGTGIGTHSDPTTPHLGISIAGCSFSGTQYAGIRIHGWSGVKIADCRFSGGVYGVIGDIVAGMQQNDIGICGCTFTGIGANTTYPIATGKVIYLLGLQAGTANFNDVRFANNNVSNSKNATMNHGCSFTYCTNVTISGNTVKDTNGFGITVYGGSYIAVIGNKVTSTIDKNIKLGGSGAANDVFRATVEGNVCNTLDVSDSALTVVTGNNASNTITGTNNAATVTIVNNLANATWA